MVAVALPHLDRPFDYAVPASLAPTALPGTRVRVRFAGRLVDGWLLERVAGSEHPGRLARIERVVSPEQVLTTEVAGLARAVADHYAGSLADVLRLAVPPRHARAERRADPDPAPRPVPPADDGPWAQYTGGAALLARVGAPVPGEPGPRAVWSALPGQPWIEAVAHLAVATLAAGRGVLVVVPDARDAGRMTAQLRARTTVGSVAELRADAGPERRYRTFLDVRRSLVRAVVGTRAAAFAPVDQLGLAVLWDDGDDLLAEPRAPYPHAREVLALRAHRTGCALVLGGYARTAEAARLVATGWARPVTAPRGVVRTYAPRVRATGEDAELARDPAARSARLPHLAWRTAHAALADGPVLVQAPRRGYVPALACQSCRTPARCAVCSGPLQVSSGHAVPACAWCGRLAGDWRCPVCAGTRLRAVTVGALRTVDELGRAFPGVPVTVSAGSDVVATVPDKPALVVATPGAEPIAAGGYAAVVLLDARALLGRADLRSGEEAARRWFGAAALARPQAPVVVVGDPALPQLQALLRWDPAGLAERELAEREAAQLPPAVRLATVTGPAAAVGELLAALQPPPGTRVLGPAPVSPGRDEAAERTPGPARARAILVTRIADGAALARALHAAASLRSARRATDAVEIRLDPVALG
ncbi:MAG: primosomal protein N' [Actinomycetota bacterium]|nr:MAG: primosomal protein N' [Actinomycetota bacterium]